MTGGAEPPDSMRTEAEACLRAMAGADARLCDDQRTAIRAGAHHVRALVVQRKDLGKSAVCFTATALLRHVPRRSEVALSSTAAALRDFGSGACNATCGRWPAVGVSSLTSSGGRLAAG
jgi:ATP-dependent DNA helicase RecQ